MAEVAVVDVDLCTACGACIDVCPTEAIAMNDDESFVVIDAALCTACGACVDECPTGALEIKDV